MTVLGHAESPLGTLLLSGDGEALTGLWFLGQKYEGAGLPENAPTDEGLPVFETARAWLRASFAVQPARSQRRCGGCVMDAGRAGDGVGGPYGVRRYG